MELYFSASPPKSTLFLAVLVSGCFSGFQFKFSKYMIGNVSLMPKNMLGKGKVLWLNPSS